MAKARITSVIINSKEYEVYYNQWGEKFISLPCEVCGKIRNVIIRNGKDIQFKCITCMNKDPERRNKVSIGRKGIPVSEERKLRIHNTLVGRQRSPESIIKGAIAQKGQVPWNKGLHLTEEDKQNKSIAHKGKLHSEEWTRKAMQSNGENHKTEPELKVEALLNYYYPNQYEYTGDGSIIINHSCPDFTNCNGQKKVIEVFGTYWHSEKKTGRTKDEEESFKKKTYGEFGFDCLIIWEYELNTSKTDINITIEKLLKFCNPCKSLMKIDKEEVNII